LSRSAKFFEKRFKVVPLPVFEFIIEWEAMLDTGANLSKWLLSLHKLVFASFFIILDLKVETFGLAERTFKCLFISLLDPSWAG
jgi:hypothetical protein